MVENRFSSSPKIRPGTYVNTKRIPAALSKNPLKPPFLAKVLASFQFPYILDGSYLMNGEIRMNARKD